VGKIIITDNVSLDGVIQNPAGDDGFRLGGWAGWPAAGEQTAQVLLDEALGTQALLFGRRRRAPGGASARCSTTRWGYAVEQGLLPANPVDKVRWAAPEVARTVDRRVVISPA
jgi:hypothetical protein